MINMREIVKDRYSDYAYYSVDTRSDTILDICSLLSKEENVIECQVNGALTCNSKPNSELTKSGVGSLQEMPQIQTYEESTIESPGGKKTFLQSHRRDGAEKDHGDE